ncbi:unnamed protein product [marine sediment metagenome]|uniref:Uncharacterized protein n=1 Tax=marine sediment metagenome TaxID=412755 RepID=X1W1S8_9ZZZZ
MRKRPYSNSIKNLAEYEKSIKDGTFKGIPFDKLKEELNI